MTGDPLIMDREDKLSAEDKLKLHAALDAAADDALRLHPGNITAASRVMQTKVRTDPRLQRALLEILLVDACTDRVRRRLQLANQQAWHEGEVEFDRTQRSQRLRRAAKVNREFQLMNYSLIGGKTIATATRADLRKNSEFQSRQGSRMLQTSRWFDLIADELADKSDDTIVRDVLGETDLRELQRAVFMDEAAKPKSGQA